jgi:hypothetical protein
MSTRGIHKIISSITVLSIIILFMSCGGGGGSHSNPTPEGNSSLMVQIEGATFVGNNPPDPSGDVTSPGINNPSTMINGGTGNYDVTLSSSDVHAILVAIQGDDGYFTYPVNGTNLHYTIQMTVLPTYNSSNITVYFALRDNQGNVSQWVYVVVPVVITGTGDVKISLSFDRNEDLDLHVIEPSGEEIYFANPSSATGGVLDLDSNPACEIDGVNNENIFWPSGTAPHGTYTVKVHYWAHCSASTVNYTVNVIRGVDISSYHGFFTASEEDETKTITTFTR